MTFYQKNPKRTQATHSTPRPSKKSRRFTVGIFSGTFTRTIPSWRSIARKSGGGYAVWKFRSGAQDGEDIHEIEKIESLGDGKYIVHYNDMGNKGTHTITTVIQDGEIFFDKLD